MQGGFLQADGHIFMQVGAYSPFLPRRRPAQKYSNSLATHLACFLQYMSLLSC